MKYAVTILMLVFLVGCSSPVISEEQAIDIAYEYVQEVCGHGIGELQFQNKTRYRAEKHSKNGDLYTVDWDSDHGGKLFDGLLLQLNGQTNPNFVYVTFFGPPDWIDYYCGEGWENADFWRMNFR